MFVWLINFHYRDHRRCVAKPARDAGKVSDLHIGGALYRFNESSGYQWSRINCLFQLVASNPDLISQETASIWNPTHKSNSSRTRLRCTMVKYITSYPMLVSTRLRSIWRYCNWWAHPLWSQMRTKSSTRRRTSREMPPCGGSRCSKAITRFKRGSISNMPSWNI